MPSEEPLRPYNRRPKSLAKLKLIIISKGLCRIENIPKISHFYS